MVIYLRGQRGQVRAGGCPGDEALVDGTALRRGDGRACQELLSTSYPALGVYQDVPGVQGGGWKQTWGRS